MKWYRKDHYQTFQKQLGMDLKLKRSLERYVLQYSKLVFKHVRKTGLEEQKVGILNLQDITQAGFEGLCDMWRNVDWKKVEESEDPSKTLVNYLSARITRTIKRQVYGDATGVAIPEYIITKTKQNLLASKLFGNWMYLFKTDDFYPGTFIRYAEMIKSEDLTSYENEEINDRLSGAMFKFLSDKERSILRWSFGIDEDKLSIKEIANRLRMSEVGVKKAKKRAIGKLDNEENYNLLKDFL